MKSKAKNLIVVIIALCLTASLSIQPACDSGGGSGGLPDGYSVDYPPLWNISLRGVQLDYFDTLAGAYVHQFFPRTEHPTFTVAYDTYVSITIFALISTRPGNDITRAEAKYWGERTDPPYGPNRFHASAWTFKVAGVTHNCSIPLPNFSWEEVQTWGSNNKNWVYSCISVKNIKWSGDVPVLVDSSGEVKETDPNDNYGRFSFVVVQ